MGSGKTSKRSGHSRGSAAKAIRDEYVTQLRDHLCCARALSCYADLAVVTYLLNLALAAVEEDKADRKSARQKISIAPDIAEMVTAFANSEKAPPGKRKTATKAAAMAGV